jgi:hypothetical protein
MANFGHFLIEKIFGLKHKETKGKNFHFLCIFSLKTNISQEKISLATLVFYFNPIVSTKISRLWRCFFNFKNSAKNFQKNKGSQGNFFDFTGKFVKNHKGNLFMFLGGAKFFSGYAIQISRTVTYKVDFKNKSPMAICSVPG